jgi:hypothetical protein
MSIIMKKYHVVAIIGTLALLTNFLVPGLAFGQGEEGQGGTIQITCPSGGSLSWTRAPANITFNPVETSPTNTQSSLDSAIRAGNDNWLYPAANVLSVTDTRSQSAEDCPEVQPGFTVAVTGSDLTRVGGTETIPGDHIYLTADGNYAGADAAGLYGVHIRFNNADGPGNYLSSSALNYSINDGLLTAANYAVHGAPMDGNSYTLLQRTGPTNSEVTIATALAIVNGIAAGQRVGTYSGVITYSLSSS